MNPMQDGKQADNVIFDVVRQVSHKIFGFLFIVDILVVNNDLARRCHDDERDQKCVCVRCKVEIEEMLGSNKKVGWLLYQLETALTKSVSRNWREVRLRHRVL